MYNVVFYTNEEWFWDWSLDQISAKSCDYEERWNEV
jgi:hypothetical protein